MVNTAIFKNILNTNDYCCHNTEKFNCRIRRFEDLRRQDQDCDITLSSRAAKSEPLDVRAHKIILSEASPYFERIFASPSFRDGSSKSLVFEELIEPSALETLVKFIYTGILDLSLQMLPGLLTASRLFELEGAARLCEAYLVQNLNVKDIWQQFKLCRQFAPGILKEVFPFINNNWGNAIQSNKDFLELDFDEIASILKSLPEDLASSGLNFMTSWIQHSEQTRFQYNLELLKLIPLKSLPAPILVEYFSQPNFKNSQECQSFINDILMELCLFQSQQINNCNNLTPVKKAVNHEFLTPIKQEMEMEDDDDVIILPSPPSPAKTIRPEEVLEEDFAFKSDEEVLEEEFVFKSDEELIQEDLPFKSSLFTPKKTSNHSPFFLSGMCPNTPSSPYSLSRKRIKTPGKRPIQSSTKRFCGDATFSEKWTGDDKNNLSNINISDSSDEDENSPVIRKTQLTQQDGKIRSTNNEMELSISRCIEFFSGLSTNHTRAPIQQPLLGSPGSSPVERIFYMSNDNNCLSYFDIGPGPNFHLKTSSAPTLSKKMNGPPRTQNVLIHSPAAAVAGGGNKGKIFSVGGISSKDHQILDTVETLDLTKNVWTPAAKLVEARFDHSVVECNGYLYAIGGSSGICGLSSVERMHFLQSPGTTWISGVKSLSCPRQAHASVEYENKIYAVGGFTKSSDGPGDCLDTMEVYDPEKNLWSFKPSMRWGRCGMAAAVFKGKLYVIGGGTELHPKKKLARVEVYNFRTKSWSSTKNLNYPRMYGSAVVLDGHLYAVGGDSALNYPTVEVFVPYSNKWEVIPGSLVKNRSYSSIAVIA